MKTILITGAAGFIGSHLTELLVSEGYKIRALTHYNSKNNWGWLETSKFKNEIEIIGGDIRDYDSVFDALKGCDTVFHLAALIGIPYSYISPLAYIKTNIEGTYNILQAAKELNLENVIITSTSETYGTAQYVPIDEKHPLVGQSPYSASKIAADQLAISFYKSYNLPVKIVRPFNTYGPRQSARAIIPTIISQLLTGKKNLNLGSLKPTRDLTYVKDTIEGFLSIAKSKKLTGEVTNVGMNAEISIKELVKIISRIIEVKVVLKTDKERLRPKNSEVERLHCDNSKLLQNTLWRPKFNLETGLNETINWIKKNIHNYKPEIYNV
ncbi:MAG: NAD-dependent 4,6-dehydratase LegB [Ignavibacteriaceae bacterium]|jgi:dTDP-glucose 4,6-dehydratase